jgi:hypothetical protein
MISVIAKIGVPFSKETSIQKKNSRAALLAEYKQAGKIVGDFILIDDSTIEIRFTDISGAERFVEDVINLYEYYSDTIEVEQIKAI